MSFRKSSLKLISPNNYFQLSYRLYGEKGINMNETNEYFGKPIFTYSSNQAVDDGILFDITEIDPSWKKGLFNYVTINLMSKGYTADNAKMPINIPNLLDLLNQSIQIVKKASNYFTEFDSFFSGDIELPNGEQQKILIVQNETGKFTIMLPEDY